MIICWLIGTLIVLREARATQLYRAFGDDDGGGAAYTGTLAEWQPAYQDTSEIYQHDFERFISSDGSLHVQTNWLVANASNPDRSRRDLILALNTPAISSGDVRRGTLLQDALNHLNYEVSFVARFELNPVFNAVGFGARSSVIFGLPAVEPTNLHGIGVSFTTGIYDWQVYEFTGRANPSAIAFVADNDTSCRSDDCAACGLCIDAESGSAPLNRNTSTWVTDWVRLRHRIRPLDDDAIEVSIAAELMNGTFVLNHTFTFDNVSTIFVDNNLSVGIGVEYHNIELKNLTVSVDDDESSFSSLSSSTISSPIMTEPADQQSASSVVSSGSDIVISTSSSSRATPTTTSSDARSSSADATAACSANTFANVFIFIGASCCAVAVAIEFIWRCTSFRVISAPRRRAALRRLSTGQRHSSAHNVNTVAKPIAPVYSNVGLEAHAPGYDDINLVQQRPVPVAVAKEQYFDAPPKL